MNRKKSFSWLIILVALGIGAAPIRLAAIPVGTAITYQGRFTDGGSPANGAYDFEFKLYDDAAAGTQVGSTLAKDDIGVTDGYFTTTLDFGSGIFTGDARWLQIAVRAGASTGTYTALNPRHELTAVPYALYTGNVTITDGGTIGAGNAKILFNDTDNRLELGDSATAVSSAFLGTATSLILDTYGNYRNIHTSHSSGGIRIYAADTLTATPTGAALQFFGNGDGTFGGKAFLDSGAGNNAAIIFRTAPTGTQITERMRITSGGNIGIGTADPGTAKLFVNGAAAGVAPNIMTNGDIVVGSMGAIFFNNYHSYAASDYVIPTGGLGTLGFFTSGAERIRINTSGNVGVGTAAPTERLDVSGTVRCVSLIQTSDEQLKADVQPLSGVLGKLDQVRAVSFRWNEKAHSLGVETSARQIGVLAQELEQAFPELVVTPRPSTADELVQNCPEQIQQRFQEDAEKTQYKAVNYSQLTVVLLEAVKELQAENRTLTQRIQALESKVQ
jgi:hypothetical protein